MIARGNSSGNGDEANAGYKIKRSRLLRGSDDKVLGLNQHQMKG